MPPLNGTWTLSPGQDLPGARDALRRANLRLPLDGYNQGYTSHGENASRLANSEEVRRLVLADFGPAALTAPPTVAGQVVTLPAQTVLVDGLPVTLCGTSADDAPVTVDASALANGTYALVLETWQAPVGPTTTYAANPSAFPGVNDAANKPTNLTFYPKGNVERTGGFVNDTPFGQATRLQVQKFLQTQYRVRLVADATLVGTSVPGAPAGTSAYAADAGLAPYGVVATATDTSQAFDGAYRAVKLCLVVKGAGTPSVTVHNDTDVGYAGQPPIPVFLPRPSLAALIAGLESSIDALETSVTGRVAALEGTSVVQDAPALDTYYRVATLPPSSGSTYDKLKVEITGAGTWSSASRRLERFVLANRGGFQRTWESSGLGTHGAIQLTAWELPDGSVSVHVRCRAGLQSAGQVVAYGLGTTPAGAIALGSPSTVVPVGTLIFDSGAHAPDFDLPAVNDRVVSLEARVAEIESSVSGNFPIGGIMIWSGSVASIPSIPGGVWQLCDGTGGTPDLRGKFLRGAGGLFAAGAGGGATDVTLSTGNLPAHTHGGTIGPITVNIDVSTDFNQSTGNYWTIKGSPQTGDPWQKSNTQTLHNEINGTRYGEAFFATFPATAYTTSSVGSGTSFSILPTYWQLAFVQRIA